MSCHFTEKISILIDGELAPAEAEEIETHLERCAACHSAQQDFLLLGQQITSSFGCPPNSITQQDALAKILGGADAFPQVKFSPNETRGRSFFVAALRNPVWGGAFAIVLLCLIAAVAFFFSMRRPAPPLLTDNAPSHSAPVDANPQSRSVPTENKGATSEVVARQSPNHSVLLGSPSPANRRKQLPRPKSFERASEFSMAAFNESEFSGAVDGPLVETAISTNRHVEQVMLLLRSLRNARPIGAQSNFDLAHEKRQSRKLISQNVVLRREAAREGDVASESLLENLEPILIDIAHLPEKTASSDVRSIKDRMQRQNIFAMLRASQSANTQEF